jgi:hypothetical protein
MSAAKSFALLGTLALAACAVVPPTGPDVLALPPEGKTLAQFQQEDTGCRGFAQQQIGYGTPQKAANRSAVGTAATGTAVGAAAGALIGAAAGSAGTGAAVGAGTGLLFGAAAGANSASASSAEMQERYDVAYAQCMAANGDRLQALPVQYYPYAYPYPYYYSYPGYYAPWFGPTVTFGFFDRFGHGFRGHAFRGRGSDGGFHGSGFGRGGFRR